MKLHNIQKITIFFCALFFSTFGHDYLKAHHDKRAHIQHANRNHHQLISHFKYRSANDSQQQCDWQCIPETNEQDQNLQLLVHGGLVAVYNVKEHVAFVVDINANIGAVFNGTSGGSVLINVKTNKGYDIPSGGWTVGKESFQQWFDQLTSFETIWNQAQKNGTAFDINKITETALHHIAQVFQFLGVEIAANVRASLRATIKIFVKNTQHLIDIFKGVIDMTSDGLGKLSIRLHGDLTWLVNTLKGIKEFVSKIPGGLKALHDQGVQLPFETIFNATSGIEAFVNLLEGVGQQLDLTKIFRDILNNPIDILKFIVDLGGDVSTGISGFFRVIYQIAAVHTDKDSLPHLIETIIRYSTSQNCDFAKIRSHVENLLKLIQDQINKYNTDDEWSTLQSFLQKLLDPKSVAIGGISISELLRALTDVGHESPIKTIIKILWSIRVSIKIQQTIPQLILSILQKLNSQISLQILTKLVPDLQLKYSATGEIDVIGTIKGQLNTHDIQPVLNDLPKLLRKLPIIGKIIKAIEDELQQIGHHEYNFDDLIKCSGAASVAAQIRKWLKASLNINASGSTDNGNGTGSENSGNNGNSDKKHGNSDESSGENSNHSGENDGKGKGGAAGGQSGENHDSNGKGKGGAAGEQSGENHGNNGKGKDGAAGGQSGENHGHHGKGKGGAAGEHSGENHGHHGHHGKGKGGAAGEHSGENHGSNGKGKGEVAVEHSGENHGNNGKVKGEVAADDRAHSSGGGMFSGISHLIHGGYHNQQQGSVKVETKKHQHIKEKNHHGHHD